MFLNLLVLRLLALDDLFAIERIAGARGMCLQDTVRDLSRVFCVLRAQAYARHPVRVTMLTCLVPLLACSFMFSVCERLADPVFADMNRAVYHTCASPSCMQRLQNASATCACSMLARPCKSGNRISADFCHSPAKFHMMQPQNAPVPHY